jgi:hypothetical protein
MGGRAYSGFMVVREGNERVGLTKAVKRRKVAKKKRQGQRKPIWREKVPKIKIKKENALNTYVRRTTTTGGPHGSCRWTM